MRRVDARSVVGLVLVVLGVVFLLETLEVVSFATTGVWAVVFALAGLVFLGVFVFDPRGSWWAAIPGFVLLSLGGVVALAEIAPIWGGSVFLGGVGVAFIAVYLARREFWWAVIPAGAFATLAVVAGLSSVAPSGDTGAIFLLGLAATFGLVYLLPSEDGRREWALIPAAVLLVLGVLTGAATSAAAGYLWPVLLILAGAYLIYRNLGTQRGS